MENNPKKSKAFIIAFILILLLLIIGYYLFTNRAKIFDTKGSTTLSKVFAPLLGTSKNKDLTIINTNPNVNTGTGATTGNITGIVITDQYGNKIVRAQAGENLKKGDVLYISGFNVNKDPIVMKAIANDKSKSLVFGVAGEDILKGEMGNVIIEGILTGIPTNRVEGTAWVANNTLYLSDKIYGGMTKNAPFAPSLVIHVGSVIKVDPVNGSIRIGGATNINTGLVNSSDSNTRGYFNSIFGTNNTGSNLNTNNNGFTLNPINIPGSGSKTNVFPDVTVTATPASVGVGESSTISWSSTNTTSCDAGKGNGTGTIGSFKTGPLTATKSFAIICTGTNGTRGGNIVVIVTKSSTPSCTNGADNPTLCTTKGGACLNKATNPPECTTTANNKCLNGADNPTLCTTKGGACLNKATNPPTCTINNKCENGAYNPPICDDFTDPNEMKITVTAEKEKINSGESTLIKWETVNAVSCKLYGGGLSATGISNKVGVATGKLTGDMSYTVLCTGKDKSTKGGDVTVLVTSPTDCPNGAFNPPICDNFTDPNAMTVTVTSDKESVFSGDFALVSWGSTNASSCSLSDGGLTGTGTANRNGVKTGALTKETSYTVLCTDKNKATKSGGVTIKIKPGTGICDNGATNYSVCDTFDNKLPIVTVTATPDNIDAGKTSVISWTSINTTKDGCNAGAGNGTGVNGSFTTPTLNITKSFAVYCTGPNGRSSNSAFVTVNEASGDTTTGNGNTTLGGPNLPAGPTLTSADVNTAPSACKVIDANPLTYTDEEQRQLDELLRKFYLIASTLKTESDLTLTYREIEEYKALIDQTKYITKQCYDQIDGEMVNGVRPGVSAYRSAGGEKIRFGNPWFKYTSRGSYLPNDVVLESSCKYCEPNTQNNMYCGNLAATKDQNIPFCEPNGKEVRAIGNFSRYINQFGIPAFGTPQHVINKGNPMTGWTKAALTYLNPLAGVFSWIWPAKYTNPGPTVQYTNLQDFEKVLNVW